MNISIVRANLEEDKTGILKFWTMNFPSWPADKYSWFYKQNPYGPAQCWIVRETENNSVVGSTAVFPRKFLIKGESVMGGITGDFGMDKNHRILGPALKLQKATLLSNDPCAFDFLYGYPNDSSEPVQRRAGYKIVGNTVRMVKILRSENYVKRYVGSANIAKSISKLVDLILKLRSKEKYRKKCKGITVEILSKFDNRFDALWRNALSNSYYKVIGERTSEFLNWRFAQCPYKKYSIFALSRKRELLGYIVYNTIKGNIHVADIFLADFGRYIDSLLSEFLLHQRKSCSDTVSIIYLGNKDMINKLMEYGFSIRDTNRKIISFVHNSELSSPLLETDNWYLTEGDND